MSLLWIGSSVLPIVFILIIVFSDNKVIEVLGLVALIAITVLLGYRLFGGFYEINGILILRFGFYVVMSIAYFVLMLIKGKPDDEDIPE